MNTINSIKASSEMSCIESFGNEFATLQASAIELQKLSRKILSCIDEMEYDEVKEKVMNLLDSATEEILNHSVKLQMVAFAESEII